MGSRRAHDSFDYVVDVSEVATLLACTQYANRPVRADRIEELVEGQVRALSGSIYREESQAGNGKTLGHPIHSSEMLARQFRHSVRRYWVGNGGLPHLSRRLLPIDR